MRFVGAVFLLFINSSQKLEARLQVLHYVHDMVCMLLLMKTRKEMLIFYQIEIVLSTYLYGAFDCMF